jgi:hypothetical protein
MLPSSSPEAVASFLTQCTTPTSTRWVRAGLACMFWIENQRYFPENTADFQRYYFWNDGRVLGREHSLVFSMRTFRAGASPAPTFWIESALFSREYR